MPVPLRPAFTLFIPRCGQRSYWVHGCKKKFHQPGSKQRLLWEKQGQSTEPTWLLTHFMLTLKPSFSPPGGRVPADCLFIFKGSFPWQPSQQGIRSQCNEPLFWSSSVFSHSAGVLSFLSYTCCHRSQERCACYELNSFNFLGTLFFFLPPTIPNFNFICY